MTIKKISPILISCVVLYESRKKLAKCSRFWFWNTDGERSEEGKKGSIWIWGNGYYTPQSDFKTMFLNFTPKEKKAAIINKKGISTPSENLPNFKNLVFGDIKVFGIDYNGRVYSFDNKKLKSIQANDSNIQLGSQLMHEDQIIYNLEEISFPQFASKIGIARGSLWGLSNSGALFTQPLETSANSQTKHNWTKIQTINKLKDVSFGQNHILMLKDDGTLYAMGSDTFGQCGFGDETRPKSGPFKELKVDTPTKVLLPENVKIDKIFSKSNFNYVISTDKEVFCFGQNVNMQLGFEEEFSEFKNPTISIPKPRSFQSYLKESKCDLQDIVLGENFSLFHCINKDSNLTQVYAMGPNFSGQLAIGDPFEMAHFKKIEDLSDLTIHNQSNEEFPVRISHLSCGKHHCMARLDEIEVNLIWGNNEFGQLGNQNNKYSGKPKILTPFKNKKVSDLIADNNNSYAFVE